MCESVRERQESVRLGLLTLFEDEVHALVLLDKYVDDSIAKLLCLGLRFLFLDCYERRAF